MHFWALHLIFNVAFPWSRTKLVTNVEVRIRVYVSLHFKPIYGDRIVVENIHQNSVLLANTPPVPNDGLSCAVIKFCPEFTTATLSAMPEFKVHVEHRVFGSEHPVALHR